MDFNLYGSHIGKDRSKNLSQDSSRSARSKDENKPRKINPAAHNFINLEVHGNPVWSAGRDRLNSGRSKDADSSRSRGSNSSRSKLSSVIGGSKIAVDSERRGQLDTFLNLNQLSQEQPRRPKNSLENLTRNDDTNDWEEISLSIQQTQQSSKKGGINIPINRSAFESQIYEAVSVRDDEESIWSGSVRTLTPGRQSPQEISHRPQTEALYERSQIQAAKTIQRWFRRHNKRRKLAKAAMKRMLSEKVSEIKSKQSPVEVLENVRKSVAPNKKVPSVRSNIYIGKYEESKAIQKKVLDKKVAEQEIEKLRLDNKIHSRPNSSRSSTAKSKMSIIKQDTKNSTFNCDILEPKDNAMNRKETHQKDNDKEEIMENEAGVNTGRSTVTSQKYSNIDTKSVTHKSEVTTIDDIFSTIKELESVDCLTDRSSIGNGRTQGGWNSITADINKLLQPDDFKTISNLHQNGARATQLTATSLNMHNKNTMGDYMSDLDQMPAKLKDSVISDSKMNDILRFLNTSEVVDDVAELDGKYVSEAPSRKWSVFDHTELEENSKHAVHEVSSKLMTMKLELEEKHRSIEMLQKALQQQRELTIRQVKETQKDMEKRNTCQKEEYEGALQRNHAFIDELISKNETLQDKCNKLVVEMKDKTFKYEEKIKNLTENHSIEVKKVESKHAAAEKLRREKWETEKTKMIKDMTIKGMENEIAQLITNHKNELRKLKQYYENEMLQSDQKSYEKYNQQLEDIRKQSYKEKEEAVQKEHDIVKERLQFDQEMQRQIQILEGQRRQLYQETSDERDRINIMATKQKTEIEKLRTQLEYKEDKVGEHLKMEFKVAKDDIQKKYENEIRELKLQSELEKQIWIETQNKKNMASLMSREQELKNEMKKSRDEEIEKVIQQLEADNTQSKEELESMFNNKLKRARDKFEAEVNELEASEKQAKEKYNMIRAEHMELQCEHESLKVMLRQKEKEIDDIKQMYETLHKEREHVSDIIRQEFADRLVATEEENRKLKRDISEMKAKLNHLQINHTEELERVQLSHQNDMTEVHNKVKEAIKRKEENMTDLRNQFQSETKQWQDKLSASEKRSEHLESLLEQQRKQLLKLK